MTAEKYIDRHKFITEDGREVLSVEDSVNAVRLAKAEAAAEGGHTYLTFL